MFTELRRLVVVFVLGVLPIDAVAQSAHDDAEKLPVPDAAAQKEATKLVKEVFWDEYDAAKDDRQRVKLAEKMMAAASDMGDDPAGRYVLLRVARDVAAKAGDVKVALQAVDDLVGHFRTDGLAMKFETSQACTYAIPI